MRDEDRTVELKPGKGTRLDVTEVALTRLRDAFDQALTYYQASDDPEQFMKEFELDEMTTTHYQRGTKSYTALNKFLRIGTGPGEEFRLTFSLNDQHQFTMDFRGWWGG